MSPEPVHVAENRKARHEYHIEERLEAGLVLTGTEVKSLRAGHCSLRDAYARVEGGDVVLYNMHVSPYEHGNRMNHDPTRPRKVLLHRREIEWLRGKTKERGYTLIPLRVYFGRSGFAKVELGLARGKRQVDKRRAIAEREARRELARAFRERQKE